MQCICMITSKITKRGQTTLPRRVRDALNIKPGQSLVYKLEGDRVLLGCHPGVLASFGALNKNMRAHSTDFKEARAAAREGWTEHAGMEGVAK